MTIFQIAAHKIRQKMHTSAFQAEFTLMSTRLRVWSWFQWRIHKKLSSEISRRKQKTVWQIVSHNQSKKAFIEWDLKDKGRDCLSHHISRQNNKSVCEILSQDKSNTMPVRWISRQKQRIVGQNIPQGQSKRVSIRWTFKNIARHCFSDGIPRQKHMSSC